jgi:hypothetical protein
VGGSEVVNPIALQTTIILRLEGGVWKSFRAVFLSAPVNESKFEFPKRGCYSAKVVRTLLWWKASGSLESSA